MTAYSYDGSFAIWQLQGEITAAGLPAPHHLNGTGYAGPGTPATHVGVFYEAALTAPQKSQLDGVLAAHVPVGPRRPRPLWEIRADVQALSAAQWAAIWADLSAAVSGGPPRKYLMDYGANAGPIFVFDWGLYVSGPTAAQQKAGQISLTALYVQDNPSFLVHPPFAPEVDVPGDEPA
jgi:hypothetical protein